MKKYLSCLLAVLLFLIACSTNEKLDEENIDKPSKSELYAEKTMANMTLKEKIGQMLIVSDDSTIADEELLNKLKEIKPGGFILFSENVESYEQATKLINDINSTSTIPMFMSIDQEGGRVQRIKSLSDQEVTIFPPMYDLGLTNDEKLAYDVGRIMGEELRAFNINMDFAPVLDIYSNPLNTVIGNRSFGTTSETVSTMALSFSKGLMSTGIIPVYKHFPGHGDTAEDSHHTLPVIIKTKEELMDLELKPFIEAINNGAEIIMVGHLAVPNITQNNTPSSLSKEIVTGLLKEELNFEGLVITDALNMGALTSEYTEEEIYIQAINAGVDILLMPEFDQTTIDIIENAIATGIIAEEEINNSVEKILELKYDKLWVENNYTKEYLNSLEHQQIVAKINS